MKLFAPFAFLVLFSAPVLSQVDHAVFDRLLSAHVEENGKVDYAGFLSEKDDLEGYVKYLSQHGGEDLSSQEEMAYWINLYNAATVLLILENYPISSILNLDGGKVWDRKWISSKKGVLSLNDIEHGILRKKFKDARIHAAVNCASKSCPPLWNRAFSGANLSAELHDRMERWVQSDEYNVLKGDHVKLSEIFKWYGEDFGADLIAYLNKYSKIKIQPSAKVSYLPYDWSLNTK